MPQSQPRPGQLGYYRHMLTAALGSALDTWGSVEGRLSAVFCAAVNAQSPEVASAAFSAVHSFEVQLDMTDAAINQAYLAQAAVLDAWKPIYKLADKLRAKRNRLAHGKIIFVSGGKGSGDVRFLPFFHYHTHKERKSFEHFSQEDIESLSDEFSKLSNFLHNFGNMIGAKATLRQQNWSIK